MFQSISELYSILAFQNHKQDIIKFITIQSIPERGQKDEEINAFINSSRPFSNKVSKHPTRKRTKDKHLIQGKDNHLKARTIIIFKARITRYSRHPRRQG